MNNTSKEIKERLEELYEDLEGFYDKISVLQDEISRAVHYGRFVDAGNLAQEMSDVFAMMDSWQAEIARLEKQIEAHEE